MKYQSSSLKFIKHGLKTKPSFVQIADMDEFEFEDEHEFKFEMNFKPTSVGFFFAQNISYL
jgi:hypothetical protein